MRDRRRLPKIRHGRRPIERARTHYWVAGKVMGQNVLNGPHDDEQDAYQWGYQNLDGDWEVIPLPTRDMRRANQIMRQRNIESGQSVGEVLKRTKHKF